MEGEKEEIKGKREERERRRGGKEMVERRRGEWKEAEREGKSDRRENNEEWGGRR